MKTSDLVERHHEACHPCDIHAGPAPELVVTCRTCSTRMQAALLSPCVGANHDERVILMLECPDCGATGQVRMQRDALGRLRTPVPKSPASGISVAASGAGYVSICCAACHPGSGRGALYQHHTVTDDQLVLEGRSLNCGHPVELRLPRTSDFRVEEHRHGPKPHQSASGARVV